jgi:hypothetical protein
MAAEPVIPVTFQTPLDDNALLDHLKETFGIEHDADIAKMIGCARQILSDIRSPNSPRKLTPYQKLCIYDRLGYAWARDAMIALFPEKISAVMRHWDNERTLNNLD